MKDFGGAFPRLFTLATDALADQVGKAAFRVLAEFAVVRSFFADDVAAAVIAGVEPHGGRGGDASRAVEVDTGTHLYERSSLRQMGGIFVFDANQGDALVLLENADGADRHGVAGTGLSDRVPFPRGDRGKTEHQHRGQHDGGEDEEGFFQSRATRAYAHTLG